MAFIVAPGAQIDGLTLAFGDLHAENFLEKMQTFGRSGGKEFHVTQVRNILDRLLRGVHQRSASFHARHLTISRDFSQSPEEFAHPDWRRAGHETERRD